MVIQVRHHDFEDDALNNLLTLIITQDLDRLNDEGYDYLAKKHHLSKKGISNLHHFIQSNLTANPGEGFSRESDNFHVIPSFEIRIECDDIHVVNLEQERGFKLRLSAEYLSLLEDPKTDEETKTFIGEKIQKAKELINHIENRKVLINKCVEYIAQYQRLFFKKGIFFLKPLLQKEVSEKIGVSQATVSRLLNSKYCDSPQGTRLLKVLCPRRYFGKTQQQIKSYIDKLCQDHPDWSDQKLCDFINDEGISIARRTVSKYRLLLGINAHYERKKTS